ncbi:MAG TPA: hypothetical protein VJ377_10955 [Dehalococcoidales bacterium]|nr:hypothetical protein [Dehalococcoidales bacterium]
MDVITMLWRRGRYCFFSAAAPRAMSARSSLRWGSAARQVELYQR